MNPATSMQRLFFLCLCRSCAGSIRSNTRSGVTSAGSPSATTRLLLEPALQQTAHMPIKIAHASLSMPAAEIAAIDRTVAPAVLHGAALRDVEVSKAVAIRNATTTHEEEASSLPMMSFVEGSVTPSPLATVAPAAPVGFAGLFDGMRFTVVRIQAIVAKVDWLQPYKQSSNTPFIGSGFAVDLSNGDPVFLTNAHVVQDAHTVQVQLPAIGQMIFEAYVPLICKRFDLAVVQLKDPKKFWEALDRHNGTMHALQVRPSMVSLGLEVAAVGFPLGSSSLKLSRGIISGTEMVDGTICYQSTAPISPGSSGGPLFAVGSENGLPGEAEELQVIGINFASSASEGAQNVNYVVPTVHLLQVLHEFHQRNATLYQQAAGVDAATLASPDSLAIAPKLKLSGLVRPKGKPKNLYPHFQLRIAPIDALGVEASEALYNTSGGCHKGVFLSRILPTSALRFAKPAVPERSFLVAVDNVTLDSFGMGRTANFLGDPTPFESLMMLRETVDDEVELTICENGKETAHAVSIRWRPEYSVAVQDVEEPHFESKCMGFEVFAGVTVMQMTMNHIVDLLKSGASQTLSRWLLIENQEVPHLLITHVEEGTYASRVLTPGMVVQKINGQNVSTLAQMRDEFQPNGVAWTLESDRGIIFSVKFKDSLAEQFATEESTTEVSTEETAAGSLREMTPASTANGQPFHTSSRFLAPVKFGGNTLLQLGTRIV